MENISEEYKHYWETNMFLHTQELDSSWRLEEAFSGYYDSSSPDGAQSTAASKTIASERNRRKKLNDRLLTLRAAVPIITKMDKASIIKDAIGYIQQLQEQERTIEAEILQLENYSPNLEQEETPTALSGPKKKRIDPSYNTEGSRTSPIFEDLELSLSCVGEKTLVVSISCSKRTDTIVKLCELFQSLNLKIIATNITAFSGKILKTVFIQANEEEKERLKVNIETAIAALNDLDSHKSV